MAPHPTPQDSGDTSSYANKSDASSTAKKEKRCATATASMAPRLQSQVQKWAKMTADLDSGGGSRGGHDEKEDETGETAARPRKKVKTGPTMDRKKTKRHEKDAIPFARQVRAPHRRDSYVSFGIGRGLARPSQSAGDKATAATAATTTLSSFPPTCLLCMVRFDSRQQLRDHESLSSKHRRQLRDRYARKLALQRYGKIAGDEAAAAAAAATSAAVATEPTKDERMSDQEGQKAQRDPKTPRPVLRPPVHIKRLPRRRGDLAPSYTSYAAPVRVSSGGKDENEGNEASTAMYHGCLLCQRRFRSRAMLRLHERESALHRARTRDPASVTAAVAAVNRAAETAGARQDGKEEDGEEADASPRIRPLLRMRPAAPSTTGTTTAQYRDRARERRLAFGIGAKGHSNGNPRKKLGRNDMAPAAAAPSKGAAILSKMGWTAGQGLGAQGGGLKEAIPPSVYRSGVGLGAEGGKLGDAADVAARRTESTYADFVQQTRDTARQRLLALEREEAEAAAAAAAAAPKEEDKRGRSFC